MYANKAWAQPKRKILVLLLVFVFFSWRTALPRATVDYSADAKEELRYVWNVEDRIYRGTLSPGDTVSDNGSLFPDEEFFMEFSWYRENGRWHCISITPRWSGANIHLDANGNIDWRKGSGTDVERLKECRWDLAKP